MPFYIAADLGAESGRVMLGVLDHGRLTLEEVHRFPNTPVETNGHMFWDAQGLFRQIRHGLSEVRDLRIAGIGVDAWGLDFAFLGPDGELIHPPYHYRDSRTAGALRAALQKLSREEIFDETGAQFLEMNSLYQLICSDLSRAGTLLFIPDIMNYWLTGVAASEPTIASTSQFFNPRIRNWSRGLLRKLDISDDILPDLYETGGILGETKRGMEIQAVVFTTASHDTASAVAAVPAEGGDGWCYISSGTWSLMGVELAEPILTREALDENFTNEAGAGNRIRFLKNIAGLWILQECRRQWAAERLDLSYDAVTHLAAGAAPLRSVIDVDQFLAPGFMTERIRNFCLQTGQEVPNSPGEIARTVLESLAVRYRLVKESLERLTGTPIARIHIVGGGAKNELLNQLTADACNATVIAGPVEAAATGNILVQSNGGDLAAIRAIVRNSFALKTYQPRSPGDWEHLVTRARSFPAPAV